MSTTQKPVEYGWPWKAIIGTMFLGFSALCFVAALIAFILDIQNIAFTLVAIGLLFTIISIFLLVKAFFNWRRRTRTETQVTEAGVGSAAPPKAEKRRWKTSLGVQLLSLLPTPYPRLSLKGVITVAFWTIATYTVVHRALYYWPLSLTSAVIAMTLSLSSLYLEADMEMPIMHLLPFLLCIFIWMGYTAFVTIVALPYTYGNVTSALVVAIFAGIVIPPMRLHTIAGSLFRFGRGMFLSVSEPAPVTSQPSDSVVNDDEHTPSVSSIPEPEVLPDDTRQGPVFAPRPVPVAHVPAPSITDNLTEVLNNNLKAVQALVSAGVFTFKQYAQLDSREAMRIFEKAGLKFKWIDIDDSQALARQKAGLPEKEKVVINPPQPKRRRIVVVHDDLTTLKGVGKVVQEVLNDRGIHSFQDLADADPKVVLEYLKQINALAYNLTKVKTMQRAAREQCVAKANIPDNDFESIGINRVNSVSLRKAGFTIASLADSTAGAILYGLEKSGVKPLPDSDLIYGWIDEAKEYVKSS